MIKRIGFLYPGEMGARLGRLMVEMGMQAVTTLDGRSPRTRQRCLDVGIKPLASLGEVVETADLILSLVPPAAALAVAEEFSSLAESAPRHQIYVDANSISPATAKQIENRITASGLQFVDASIHGLASRLTTAGVIYLSGARAQTVAAIFADRVRVKPLGETPGQASAFKMLASGLSKGLPALFIEIGLAARSAGLLDELLNEFQHIYPAVMEVIERLLPTLPRHARRRGDELREVEGMMLDLGCKPGMIAEARRIVSDFSAMKLDGSANLDSPGEWSVKDVIEEAFSRSASEAQTANER